MKKHHTPPPNRRQFIFLCNCVLARLALGPVATAETHNTLAEQNHPAFDSQRPQFHLLPTRNWMNDPNGPIYVRGRYHMFFQYNPKGPTWGNMSWNHAVSRDMLHWELLPLALTPTEGTADSFGCFSGSALQVGRRVYLIYTGTRNTTAALATLNDGKITVQESQCLAYSDDPLLIHWTKIKDPVIPTPPPNLKVTGFRDPSIWRQESWYYMTVGSGEENVGGCVLLYRSRDLRQWTYLHKLFSGNGSKDQTVNAVDSGDMWECPDFFALDHAHVLIYSTQGKVYWQSGVLDAASMVFTPAKTGLLDLDAFYAPKTQLDQHGRRILWGWIPERRSENEMLKAGWSGAMSLPKVLSLDSDGTLRIQMLPELSTLRDTELPNFAAADATIATLPNSSGEVFCTGPRDRAFSFTLTDQASKILQISYDPLQSAFIVNGTKITLLDHDIPTIRVFIDASITETLLAERIAYTGRFYISANATNRLRITTTASTLRTWTVRPISPGRPTTTATQSGMPA